LLLKKLGDELMEEAKEVCTEVVVAYVTYQPLYFFLVKKM
jgi:hypothetical protein